MVVSGRAEGRRTVNNQANDSTRYNQIAELSDSELEMAWGGTSSLIHTVVNVIKAVTGQGQINAGPMTDLYEG